MMSWDDKKAPVGRTGSLVRVNSNRPTLKPSGEFELGSPQSSLGGAGSPKAPGGVAVPSSPSANDASVTNAGKDGWWKVMDQAGLNADAEAAANNAASGGGGFVPQWNVTGQNSNYISNASGEVAPVPAQEGATEPAATSARLHVGGVTHDEDANVANAGKDGWWKHMDNNHLNKVEEAEDKSAKSGFVPQWNVTGQTSNYISQAATAAT